MRWTLLLLLYCWGCSQTGKIADTQQLQKPDELSADYLCRGNEPFWMVKIDKAGMVFQTPEEAPMLYSVFSTTTTGSAIVFEGDWKSKEERRYLKVTIEKQPCADGMSDKAYAYTAKVEKDEKSYTGCAEKQ